LATKADVVSQPVMACSVIKYAFHITCMAWTSGIMAGLFPLMYNIMFKVLCNIAY